MSAHETSETDLALGDAGSSAAIVRPRWLTPLRRVPPSLVLAWAVIAIVLLWAAVPTLFTDYSGTEGVPGQQLRAPDWEHVLGTDGLGRDVYARIVHGAVHSLSGAFVAVTVGLLLGTLLGLVAGARGGWTDAVIMRLVDSMLAVPSLLLSLSITGPDRAVTVDEVLRLGHRLAQSAAVATRHVRGRAPGEQPIGSAVS